MHRYRISYQKGDAIKYTGNLDLQKAWERSCRRAALPLVYSQGFHPQPKINLACPLPLGMTSNVELVDIWLAEECAINQLMGSLVGAVPPGIVIDSINEVSLQEPALQMTVQSAYYTANLHPDIDSIALNNKISELLASGNLPRLRRKKTYDLRPLILDLSLEKDLSGQPILQMHLTVTEGKTGRPDEVLLALDIDPSEAKIVRTRLIRTEN